MIEGINLKLGQTQLNQDKGLAPGLLKTLKDDISYIQSLTSDIYNCATMQPSKTRGEKVAFYDGLIKTLHENIESLITALTPDERNTINHILGNGMAAIQNLVTLAACGQQKEALLWYQGAMNNIIGLETYVNKTFG